MADNRPRRNYNEYVTEGSGARKLAAVPERQPERRPERQPVRTTQPSKRAKENYDRAYIIDRKFLFGLILAVGAIFYMCVGYIQVQAQIMTQKNDIVTKQEQLTSLVNENSALCEELNSSIDLQEIKKIATKKLHMVYAGADQTIYYESSNPDYVKQYDEISK